MKTTNKLVALMLLIFLPVISSIGQDTNQETFTTSESPKAKVEKRITPASQTNTVKDSCSKENFSLVEYFRNNPEDFSTKYQAYMRTRLVLNGDSIKEKLDAEVLKVKKELNDNPTDYSKIVYTENPAKETKDQGQITASTMVSTKNQKVQKL